MWGKSGVNVRDIVCIMGEKVEISRGSGDRRLPTAC